MCNFVLGIMRRIYLHIILIVLIAGYGCKPNSKKVIQGVWVKMYSKGESVNDFRFIEFNDDSVKLFDYDLVSYYMAYRIENDSIFIGDIKSAFAIVDDTNIELLNHYFVKKEHARELDAYEDLDKYKAVEINLPEYAVSQDTFKSSNQKNFYTENISIDVIDGRNTLFLYGYKVFINDLEEMGSSHQRAEAITLFIDKEASMGFVDSVFCELDSMQIHRFSFVLGNDIDKQLMPSTKVTIYPFPFVSYFSRMTKIDNFPEDLELRKTVFIGGNKLVLNGESVDSLTLVANLKESILSKKPTLIIYGTNTTYDHFIKYLCLIKNLYSDIRNQHSIKTFGKTFNALDSASQRQMTVQIPQRIIYADYKLYQKLLGHTFGCTGDYD